VVGDTRHRLERDPFFTVYYPAPAWYPTLLLKTAIHPSLVMNEIRTAVGEVDPTMSIASLRELVYRTRFPGQVAGLNQAAFRVSSWRTSAGVR
jgi:hypothetical protein